MTLWSVEVSAMPMETQKGPESSKAGQGGHPGGGNTGANPKLTPGPDGGRAGAEQQEGIKP